MPASVLTLPFPKLAQLLLQPTAELEMEDWEHKLSQTSDPVEAAELVASWLLDLVSAKSEALNFQEWERQPDETRQPWSEGTVPNRA